MNERPTVLLWSTGEKICISLFPAGVDGSISHTIETDRFDIVILDNMAGTPEPAMRVEIACRPLQIVLQCGALRLCPNTHHAWLREELLDLTHTEFTILKCLARKAGQVVTRDELAMELYQREATPYERTIDVHVSNLRKKLHGTGAPVIRTIRGAGYLMGLAAQRQFDNHLETVRRAVPA